MSELSLLFNGLRPWRADDSAAVLFHPSSSADDVQSTLPSSSVVARTTLPSAGFFSDFILGLLEAVSAFARSSSLPSLRP